MNKKTKKLNRLNGGDNNNNNNTSNKKSIVNKIKSIDRTNVANFVGKIADAPTSIPKSIYKGTKSGIGKIGIKPAMEKLGDIKNDIKNDISDSEYIKEKKKETKKGIEFKEKVIDDFANEYLNGRTPNPCVRCNSYVKWDAFIEQANELGADFIATGHYAIIDSYNGETVIKQGVDSLKDQAYV